MKQVKVLVGACICFIMLGCDKYVGDYGIRVSADGEEIVILINEDGGESKPFPVRDISIGIFNVNTNRFERLSHPYHDLDNWEGKRTHTYRFSLEKLKIDLTRDAIYEVHIGTHSGFGRRTIYCRIYGVASSNVGDGLKAREEYRIKTSYESLGLLAEYYKDHPDEYRCAGSEKFGIELTKEDENVRVTVNADGKVKEPWPIKKTEVAEASLCIFNSVASFVNPVEDSQSKYDLWYGLKEFGMDFSKDKIYRVTVWSSEELNSRIYVRTYGEKIRERRQISDEVEFRQSCDLLELMGEYYRDTTELSEEKQKHD